MLLKFERQVREAVEIARAPGQTLLNEKQEYNRCLLQRMIMEGPKTMKNQEEEFRRSREDPLTASQEEAALRTAKESLKLKMVVYKEQKGPPVKRQRT